MIRVLHPVPVPAPERLFVRGERFHHLAHVLRVRTGTEVEVFDGAGRSYSAKVAAISDGAVELILGEARDARPQRRITVVQALPKGDKLEWIIEKAVELGAAAILPVSTARAVVRLDAERAWKRLARWRKIAEEAARQCGRSELPEVLAPVELDQLTEAIGPGTAVLVLDEEERARTLSDAVRAIDPDAPIAVVIGPEGGLERSEVARLVSAGGVPVTLGGLVLRTETAALAALAVVRHLDGHLG